MHGNRTLTTIQSLWHPSMIYKALINPGRGIRRERIRPTRRDSHGGRSDEFISRACIACRHYAIDSNTYKFKPFTHQEARGIDASFKGLRVHSRHKGEETGGNPLSREETTLLSMCAPHLRPLIALSQRFRSCSGTSVLLKTPGAYTRVDPVAQWLPWRLQAGVGRLCCGPVPVLLWTGAAPRAKARYQRRNRHPACVRKQWPQS